MWIEFEMNVRLGDAASTWATDGDAKTEMVWMLYNVATKLRNGGEHGKAHDLNGNYVGDWWLKIVDENGDPLEV